MKYTKTQLLDAYCDAKGYQSDLPLLDEAGRQTRTEEGELITESNPETKAKFLKRTERENSIDTAVRHLRNQARRESDEEVTADSEGIKLE